LVIFLWYKSLYKHWFNRNDNNEVAIVIASTKTPSPNRVLSSHECELNNPSDAWYDEITSLSCDKEKYHENLSNKEIFRLGCEN